MTAGDKTDFENGHRFELSTSTALIGKAPPRFNWTAFYRTFSPTVMTPREMAVHIWRGYPFTPVWKSTRREENFVSGGHIAFDFDAGDETSSLDYLLRVGTFAWMFASFGYATPSSTDDAPRSRLVFVLEYPVYDAAEYREIYQAVAWCIARDGSHTDPACKDPLRLYYGSKGCKVAPNWSVLGAATIEYILEEYEAAHPPAPPRIAPALVPVAPDEKRVNGKLAQLGRRVANAPLGEGHITLLRQARLAGGYIASGSLDEAAVINELTAAAMRRPEANEAEIQRAIADGIANGKAQPVQFTAAPGLMEMFR